MYKASCCIKFLTTSMSVLKYKKYQCFKEMSSIKMCEKCNLSNNACNLTALFNFPIIFSDVLNTQRMKNDLGIST